jgi:hypothetical protein
METEKIIEVILAERSYQDKAWPKGKLPMSPSDELRLIRRYLEIADQEWHKTPDNESTGTRVNPSDLDVIRRIAAICFRCMQNHGVVERGTLETKR